MSEQEKKEEAPKQETKSDNAEVLKTLESLIKEIEALKAQKQETKPDAEMQAKILTDAERSIQEQQRQMQEQINNYKASVDETEMNSKREQELFEQILYNLENGGYSPAELQAGLDDPYVRYAFNRCAIHRLAEKRGRELPENFSLVEFTNKYSLKNKDVFVRKIGN